MDLKKIKANRDNGVIISRCTWDAVLDRSIELEAARNIEELSDEQIAGIYKHTFESQPDCARAAPKCPPLVILFARAVISTAIGKPDGGVT